jgi:signal transduction histidine kinase
VIRAVAARALWLVILGAYIGFVYAVVVLGGDLVVSGDRGSTALIIVAAAVVAVSFGWVRRRARRFANRVVLGARATPLETLNQFSQGIAAAYGADEVLTGMARVLADGAGARRAEVWLVVGDQLRRAGVWPAVAGGDEVATAIRALDDLPRREDGIALCVPVWADDEMLGVLALAPRPGRPFTAAEEGLVADLASHASLVLQNVRLSAELAARNEDLAAQTEALQESRRRLVAARTAERRRVERNIHDGAQQHLVALLVRIGLLPSLAEGEDATLDGELAGLAGMCDEALETLDDLARGLHPRDLAEGGLVQALSARAARVPAGIEATVEAVGVGRYPPDIEAAAYFASLEAIQNAVKYASCSTIVVRLAEEGDRLTFAVQDDGVGFDAERVPLGAGLANMADRIEALNGRLEVASAPGEGTTVHGELPRTASVASGA